MDYYEIPCPGTASPQSFAVPKMPIETQNLHQLLDADVIVIESYYHG